MKNLFHRAIYALIAFTFLATHASQAQQWPKIPIDENVRIGKLPNGLTYYIRHNENPKGQAEFFIAQKVGSVLEEENQRGLAHFLEHMCFNGTKHFPGNQVIDWLETKGVKFGANLNAYTSIDETVYNLSRVPVTDKNVQDSCLLVLHDWANDLILDPEEIEKERGVIHQEWRTSMVGQKRIYEKILPIIYPGNPYGERLPIGIMEVVDNFPPQALRDYYEKWYRPDLQGIMIVGDVDVDYIEGKIKEIFADIEMPENAAERVYFPIADNKETIFAIGSDKEQQYGVAFLNFKFDAFPKEAKENVGYLANNYINGMISSMFANRLNELASKPDAQFAQGDLQIGDFMISKTKGALSVVAVAKGNDIRPAFEAVYREVLRAARNGFTQSEYDRVKANYLASLTNSYNNRDKISNESYVKSYVRHFIDNEPISGSEFNYQIMTAIANQIPLEAINNILKNHITDENRVMVVMAPENDSFHVPTEAELKESIAKVEGETIEAYVDNVKTDPLIPNLPAPGKIVSEKQIEQWGATEFVLSNGIKVYVKPTTFKKDEIVFSGSANGGLSVLPYEMAESQQLVSDAMGSALQLGSYSSLDLGRYLTGKQASCGLSFGLYGRSVSGYSTIKDLPTAMELLYALFTESSLNEEEFEAMRNTSMAMLANQESNPQFIFSRDVSKSSFKAPARKNVVTSEVMKNANRKEIESIMKKMVANAGDFTFTFVGSIDMDALRPLLEQYVATLPVDASASLGEVKINPDYEMITGKTSDAFTTKMVTPQTFVLINAFGKLPYTAKNRYVASIAGQIIGQRLNNTVREEMGAVYSIGANGGISRLGENNANISTSFPMKPEMKKEVIEFIGKLIEKSSTDITPEEVSKQVEYMIKNYKDGLDKNSTWLGALGTYAMYGEDNFFKTEEILNSITPEDIQNYIKDILKQNNYRIVTLDAAE